MTLLEGEISHLPFSECITKAVPRSRDPSVSLLSSHARTSCFSRIRPTTPSLPLPRCPQASWGLRGFGRQAGQRVYTCPSGDKGPALRPQCSLPSAASSSLFVPQHLLRQIPRKQKCDYFSTWKLASITSLLHGCGQDPSLKVDTGGLWSSSSGARAGNHMERPGCVPLRETYGH